MKIKTSFVLSLVAAIIGTIAPQANAGDTYYPPERVYQDPPQPRHTVQKNTTIRKKEILVDWQAIGGFVREVGAVAIDVALAKQQGRYDRGYSSGSRGRSSYSSGSSCRTRSAYVAPVSRCSTSRSGPSYVQRYADYSRSAPRDPRRSPAPSSSRCATRR